jgi:GNAT superfamily N-acetyltransferase
VTATAPKIIEADTANLPRLTELLTTAFAHNPVSDWLFRGRQDRHHPAFFAAHLRYALAAGRIDQTDDGNAVAVWIDYTRRAETITARTRFGTEAADAVGDHLLRWTLLDASLHGIQPAEPHWRLAFLAAHPGHQHQGQGGLLLHHATTWQRHLAYLEATANRLVTFYARHGYTAGRPVHIPKGPTLHPMRNTRYRSSLRQPGGGANVVA